MLWYRLRISVCCIYWLCVLTICVWIVVFFFFFQAEDGIRDLTVTGVQTCALPISLGPRRARDGSCRRGMRRARGARASLDECLVQRADEAIDMLAVAPQGHAQRRDRKSGV